MGYHICGVYKDRPAMCQRYPERDSYIPEGCTYYFDAEGKRQGFCDPECQAECCRLPRHQGEPTAPAMPEIAGGLPCKYIKYVEHHPAMSSDGEADTEPVIDRGSGGRAPNPLELALAEINSRKGDRTRLEALGGGGRTREGGKER